MLQRQLVTYNSNTGPDAAVPRRHDNGQIVCLLSTMFAALQKLLWRAAVSSEGLECQ